MPYRGAEALHPTLALPYKAEVIERRQSLCRKTLKLFAHVPEIAAYSGYEIPSCTGAKAARTAGKNIAIIIGIGVVAIDRVEFSHAAAAETSCGVYDA